MTTDDRDYRGTLDWSRYAPEFTEAEFACPLSGRADMDPAFMDRLYAIRSHLGFPMLVSHGGGFRCFEYNTGIGGAPKSFHLIGRAADIIVAHSGRMWRLISAVTEFPERQMGGIILYERHIHLDDRQIEPTGIGGRPGGFHFGWGEYS